MAASQWGHTRRIFLYARENAPEPFLSKNLGGSENFVVVINPEYAPVENEGPKISRSSEARSLCSGDEPRVRASESMHGGEPLGSSLDFEGCFSVPGKRGLVRRHARI